MVKRSLSIGVLSTAVGQLLLVLAEPLTRASGTYVTRSRQAFLAPDSHWYLERAMPGESLGDVGWTTWGYVLMLRAGHYAGDAAVFAVIVQVLLAVVAGAALFHIVTQRHGPFAGFLASAALTMNPLTAQWVRFILTEGVFQPLMVLIVIAVSNILVGDRPMRPRAVGAVFALAGLALITRPNGFLVVLSVFALLALKQATRRRKFLLLTTTGLLTPVLMFAALSTTGQPSEATLADQWYRGVVLEGTAEVRRTIPMPSPADASDTSEAALARYAMTHPVSALRLMTTRIVVEVAQVRPHYPLIANIAAGAAILLYLFAAVVGAITPGAQQMRRASLFLAIPHLLLVGVTFATPEARYGWSGMIALSPLVGIGANRVVVSLGRRFNGQPSQQERTC